MLTIYIVAAIMGGVLVLFSALGGGEGDLDQDVDLEADADVELEAGIDADTDGPDGGDLASWLPFLSLRFWTYFTAFFGLSGVLLSTLTEWGGTAVATAAVGVGFTTGFGVATFMRLLAKTQTDSGIGSRDMIGAEGVVLLPVRVGDIGKIRVQIKGDVIDLIARVDGDEPLDVGAEVMIVAFEENTATVIPREELVKRLAADRRGLRRARSGRADQGVK